MSDTWMLAAVATCVFVCYVVQSVAILRNKHVQMKDKLDSDTATLLKAMSLQIQRGMGGMLAVVVMLWIKSIGK